LGGATLPLGVIMCSQLEALSNFSLLFLGQQYRQGVYCWCWSPVTEYAALFENFEFVNDCKPNEIILKKSKDNALLM
jgi:hypothetical protein